MRPISILCNAYLPEHYKIETGSGARLVLVRFGEKWSGQIKSYNSHQIIKSGVKFNNSVSLSKS
ncbi:hypothetical protein C7972_102124 [Arenibacter sp. ARW7G5Y1]|nr:hypothetical protein C7972_102124 [Arenibacter sp. ARW7G5Y1]